MNKDEILNMSRKENEGKESEWERSVANKASRAGRATGIVFCVILVLLDDILLNTRIVGLASWIVFFSMEAASNLLLYRNYRKKSSLFLSVIDIFCVIADLTMLVILGMR